MDQRGANRFESFITPDTMDLIESTMNRKTRLVCLDPRFIVTAAKADSWFPIRPGTDMDFILGMLNVIVKEKRYNPEFVENYCYGFDRLVEHIEDYTPGVGSQGDRNSGRGNRKNRAGIFRCCAPGPGHSQRHRGQPGPAGRHGAEPQVRAGRVPVLPLG